MILREMVDETVLDLVDKRVVTNHASLHVGYGKDVEGPSHTSVSQKLPISTNSFDRLMAFMDDMYCENVCRDLPIRRMNIAFGNLDPEECVGL